MNTATYEDDRVIERAITFLVQTYTASGHNPKPVILHSIRTGLYLAQQGYPQDVVVAGILHDIVEDTNVELGQVERQFGAPVAHLVAANSFDPAIADHQERDLDLLERCRKGGKFALIVKAADILDNTRYYRLSAESEKSHWLLHKLRIFLELSADDLAGDPVWLSLRECYGALGERAGIPAPLDIHPTDAGSG